jgi:hypothetical protein
MRPVEVNEIVPENEAAAVGERIETVEGVGRIAALDAQALAAVAAQRRPLPDALAYFEVDRQAAWLEGWGYGGLAGESHMPGMIRARGGREAFRR